MLSFLGPVFAFVMGAANNRINQEYWNIIPMLEAVRVAQSIAEPSQNGGQQETAITIVIRIELNIHQFQISSQILDGKSMINQIMQLDPDGLAYLIFCRTGKMNSKRINQRLSSELINHQAQ